MYTKIELKKQNCAELKQICKDLRISTIPRTKEGMTKLILKAKNEVAEDNTSNEEEPDGE